MMYNFSAPSNVEDLELYGVNFAHAGNIYTAMFRRCAGDVWRGTMKRLPECTASNTNLVQCISDLHDAMEARLGVNN